MNLLITPNFFKFALWLAIAVRSKVTISTHTVIGQWFSKCKY